MHITIMSKASNKSSGDMMVPQPVLRAISIHNGALSFNGDAYTVYVSAKNVSDIALMDRNKMKSILDTVTEDVLRSVVHTRNIGTECMCYRCTDLYIYVCRIDHKFVTVVTNLTYSRRSVHVIIEYLSTKINKCTTKEDLQKLMNEAMEIYKDHTDRLAQIQTYVSDIKLVSTENVERLLTQGETIDDIIQKSAMMSNLSKVTLDKTKQASAPSMCIIM